MKTFVPKKPVGESPLWIWRRWIWDFLAGGQFPIRGHGDVVVTFEQGFYRVTTKNRPAGGSAGVQWQKPNRELDPTVAIPWNGAGTWVYVSPYNPLVLTGMLDLVSGDNTACLAGWYQTLQAVPAQVVNPSGKPAGTYYNVPKPAAKGAVTGTPLKGDLDKGTGNEPFFLLVQETSPC